MISRQKKIFILILFFLFCFTINIFGKNNKKIITFWHLDARPEQQTVWQKMADEFMKSHPSVKIEITALTNEAFMQKISVVMLSRNPPDLFRSWGGGLMIQWAEAGLLRDITNEVKKWPSEIGKGVIGVYSYKGKTYGLPYDMGAWDRHLKK